MTSDDYRLATTIDYRRLSTSDYRLTTRDCDTFALMLPSRLLIVRQNFPDLRLADVRAEARLQLERSGFATRLQPGARVAIGVGSRGIANIADHRPQRRAVLARSRDGAVCFPRDGQSRCRHARGTGGRPRAFRDHRTVNGLPRSSAAPTSYRSARRPMGSTSSWTPRRMRRTRVMIVARVKWHTTFDGRLESGLMKMMAIGLGKFAGAQKYHTHAQRLGLEHVIRTVGRRVLESGKMIGGLAILEDAHHNTARLDAVPADCMEQRDEENLALAKSWMPRLPCNFDVLDRRRDGQEHQRHGHGRESHESRTWLRIQSLARHCRRSNGSSFASWIRRRMATRWESGWRTSRRTGSSSRSIGSRHGSTR